MLVAIFALAIAGDAPSSVRVCSDMKVDVEGVMFEPTNGGANVVVDATLKPGACADVPQIAPGDYSLHFIDVAPGGQSAMCVRRVTVKAGDTVRINPDDGASCIL
ncbi:MAG TPA: hypothetical protein VGL66_03065 [Caulobacteraceae bacterium]|jgi:hypothetical protein